MTEAGTTEIEAAIERGERTNLVRNYSMALVVGAGMLAVAAVRRRFIVRRVLGAVTLGVIAAYALRGGSTS